MTYLDIYNIDGGNPAYDTVKKFISANAGIIAIILAVLVIILIGLIYSALVNSKECGICPAPQPCPLCPPEKVCVHDPTKCVHDPTKCVHDPTKCVHDPTKCPTLPTNPEMPINPIISSSNEVSSEVSTTIPSNNSLPEESNNLDLNTDNFNNYENFTNDLPYQLNNNSIKLNENDDYEAILQKMSLDSNVIKQHNQYVTDRNKITSTASYVPARSDTQDIVTYWGLPRRSQMFSVDPSAREVPSQDPEQGSKPIKLRWD